MVFRARQPGNRARQSTPNLAIPLRCVRMAPSSSELIKSFITALHWSYVALFIRSSEWDSKRSINFSAASRSLWLPSKQSWHFPTARTSSFTNDIEQCRWSESMACNPFITNSSLDMADGCLRMATAGARISSAPRRTCSLRVLPDLRASSYTGPYIDG